MPLQPRSVLARGGWRLLAAGAVTALASLALPATTSAADPCAVGKALVAAGDPASAKAVYVGAIKADPSLACATKGLESLTSAAGGTSISSWLTTVGADAGLAATLCIIALTAAAILFVALSYPRPTAAVLARLVPWAYRRRLALSPFEDGGGESWAPGVTALVRSELAAAASRQAPFTLDRLTGTETLADSIGELTDAVGQLKGLAAVLRFVGNAARLPRYTLSGTVQPGGASGGGVSLVLDRQRDSEDAATIWSGVSGKDVDEYQALAPGAAAWAEYTLREREGLAVPPVTNDALSYAHLQIGLRLDGSGDAHRARLAYRRAVDRDPDNVASLVNLGLSNARAERFDEAIYWLQRTLRTIEAAS